MKQAIYAIYDDAAAAFMTPFFVQNDQVAKRSFRDACLTEGTAMFNNRSDFTLHTIGVFDSDTGEITPIQAVIDNGQNYEGK